MKALNALGVLFLLCFTPCLLSAQSDTQLQNLKKYIDFRAQNDRYSGVTAIYKNDSINFLIVHGFASRPWQIKNKSDTKFDLASVTKMFTATAIAILLEQKKLNLNAPFISYFPDFPVQEANKITIKQLMQHTSGFSDLFFEKAYLKSDRNRLRKLEDYDQFYELLRIGKVSENQISYSNTNYLILGRIIEKVSGLDYYTFLDEHIFQPLKMNSTGFFEKDEIVMNKAEGYFIDPQAAMEFEVPNDGRLRSNVAVRPVKGMPAGGAFSTVNNMHKFIMALRNEKLINESTFKTLISSPRAGYGLGIQVYEQNGISVWGHSGGFYGVSTMVFYLPENDITFISLTNSDFAAQPVFDSFLNILAGEKIHQPVILSTSEIKKAEGFYKVSAGEMKDRQIEIIAKDDRLIFDGALEFFPIGKNRFFDIDNPGFVLEFEEDGKKNITGFTRSDERGFYQKAIKTDASSVKVLKSISLSEEELKEYLVDFQFQEGGMMAGHCPTFSVDNKALIVDNMMRFLPFEKDKFFLQDDTGMKLIFIRNENNDIVEINVTREKNAVGRLMPVEKEDD
jgi:CubicO group peptidase (beta-lactamase class C family)